MLQITINRNRNNQIKCFEAKGHCNFGEKGKDVVCSGASTLLQVAIYGLDKFCTIPPQAIISEGNLACVLSEINKESQVILETMLIGLREIEKYYPNCLKIEEII